MIKSVLNIGKGVGREKSQLLHIDWTDSLSNGLYFGVNFMKTSFPLGIGDGRARGPDPTAAELYI